MLFRARDAMAEQLEPTPQDQDDRAANDDPNDETFLGASGIVGGTS